ncbi:unnamed protein product [Ixodes persulcatus]
MSSSAREPCQPSSLYKSAVADRELVSGGRCVHHCTNDAPLEGYCGVYKHDGGSAEGTTAFTSFLDQEQAGKSSAPRKYCRDVKLEGYQASKIPVVSNAETGLPAIDSESSIMNIIQKVSDIEVSVDFIDSSIDAIMARIKEQREKALPAKVTSGSSGVRSRASSSTASSSGNSSAASSSSSNASVDEAYVSGSASNQA